MSGTVKRDDNNTPVVGGVDNSGNIASEKMVNVSAGVGDVEVSLVATGTGNVFRLADGVTQANLVTVAQFHNADNQSLPGTAFGILSGGVGQYVNALGNLNRATETWTDNRPNVGISTGASQNAVPITTVTIAQAVTANASAQQVSVSALTGTVRGNFSWNLQAGHIVQIGGANPENVFVTAVGAGKITAIFTKNHSNTDPCTFYVYNQQRDATLADGSTPAGINAGAAFLWNSGSNAGQGGMEIERAFSGELMGATGAGAATAVEYEDTGGGPVLASGIASGSRLFPGQALLGKGRATNGSITSTTAGNTSVVFPSAAATNTITAGHAIYLTGSGTPEWVFTANTWTPGSSATVPLANPVVNTGQTSAEWSVFAANGPGLNGFRPDGVGIEEEALYSPSTGLYYIERASDSDAMVVNNIVAESEALYNGTTFDRARSNISATLQPSAAYSSTFTSPDQLNVNGHALHVILDATVIGSATLTISINGKDPASGKYYTLLAGAVVNTNSTNVYKVGPALTAAANLTANDWVPRTFQIVVTQGGSGNATYSLGYNLSE